MGTFVLQDTGASSTTHSQILKLEGCTNPSHPAAITFICFSLYASWDESAKPANTSSWRNLIKKLHWPFLGAKLTGISLFARVGAAPIPPLESSNPHSRLKTTSVMEKPQFYPKPVLAKVSGQHREVTGRAHTTSDPSDTIWSSIGGTQFCPPLRADPRDVTRTFAQLSWDWCTPGSDPPPQSHLCCRETHRSSSCRCRSRWPTRSGGVPKCCQHQGSWPGPPAAWHEWGETSCPCSGCLQ